MAGLANLVISFGLNQIVGILLPALAEEYLHLTSVFGAFQKKAESVMQLQQKHLVFKGIFQPARSQ